MAAHKKTHCKNGHPRTAENVNSNRNCLICMRARSKCRDTKAVNAARRRQWRVNCDGLTDTYINRLIHQKTGLPVSQISEADRVEHRKRVLIYREKRHG